MKHKMTTAERSKTVMTVIWEIADRAVLLYDSHNIPVNRLNVMMDISTCHFHAQRLRLDDLLVADDFNFLHDVAGINKHLDHETKQLRDCFSPRFSEKEKS